MGGNYKKIAKFQIFQHTVVKYANTNFQGGEGDLYWLMLFLSYLAQAEQYSSSQGYYSLRTGRVSYGIKRFSISSAKASGVFPQGVRDFFKGNPPSAKIVVTSEVQLNTC